MKQASLAAPGFVKTRLDALRTELAELAFELEQRGRRDAADVAMMVAARVEEIRDELAMDAVAGGGDILSDVSTAAPLIR